MASWPPPIEGTIKRWLEEQAPGFSIEARLEYPLRYPDGVPGCGADLGIMLPNQLIFLEVDNSGTPIDTNVSKYWPWLEAQRPSKPVLLIHILNPKTFTGQSYRSHVMIAQFIADQIARAWPGFLYVQVKDLSNDENWHQTAIEQVQELIRPHLDRLLQKGSIGARNGGGDTTPVDLTGTWQSFITESADDKKQGKMTLRQAGDLVEGTDQVEEVVYRLNGRVERDTFIGTWEGDGYFGTFSFGIEGDGNRLEGHYTTNPGKEPLPYRANRMR